MKPEPPERSPVECMQLDNPPEYVEQGRAEYASTGASQFGLRGMFILTTALCLTLGAVAAVGFREPRHVLGALIITLFCAGMIAVVEVCRRQFGAELLHAPPRQKAGQSPFAVAETPFADATPAAMILEEQRHIEH